MPVTRLRSVATRLVATLALLGCVQLATDAAPAAEAPTAPKFQWFDLKMPGLAPGAKMAMLEGSIFEKGPVRFQLSMPPNWTFPPHFHDTDERLTVLEGAVYMSEHGMSAHDGSAGAMEVGPASRKGNVTEIPASMAHWALTRDEPALIEVATTGPYTIHWVAKK